MKWCKASFSIYMIFTTLFSNWSFQSSSVNWDFSVVYLSNKVNSTILQKSVFGRISNASCFCIVITFVDNFIVLQPELLFIMDYFTNVVANLWIIKILHQNVRVVIWMLTWGTIEFSYLWMGLLYLLVSSFVVFGNAKVDSLHVVFVLNLIVLTWWEPWMIRCLNS